MVFHLKKLFLFRAEPDRRKYLKFVFHLFQLSLLDVTFAAFWAILFILPWRRAHAKRLIDQRK